MLERGNQTGTAAAYMRVGGAGWQTITVCYVQRQILQRARPLLEKKPSAWLDVKGSECTPSVTQDQKVLGTNYF